MLAANMSGSEKKVNEKTYDISSIERVTRSFWKFHLVVVRNNGKEMYKKRCAASAKLLFGN